MKQPEKKCLNGKGHTLPLFWWPCSGIILLGSTIKKRATSDSSHSICCICHNDYKCTDQDWAQRIDSYSEHAIRASNTDPLRFQQPLWKRSEHKGQHLPDTPPYVVLLPLPTAGHGVPSAFSPISPETVLVAVTPSAPPVMQKIN